MSDPTPFVKVTRPQSDQHPEVWREERVAPTLNGFDNTGDSRATVVLAHDPEVVGPLTATGMSRARGTESIESSHVLAVDPPTVGVRRLTPIECERLQGWPDDHTRWRADGTENSDSARYRMIGNGVAAPVAQWLAEQITELWGDR